MQGRPSRACCVRWARHRHAPDGTAHEVSVIAAAVASVWWLNSRVWPLARRCEAALCQVSFLTAEPPVPEPITALAVLPRPVLSRDIVDMLAPVPG